jgi:hypothetical protein
MPYWENRDWLWDDSERQIFDNLIGGSEAEFFDDSYLKIAFHEAMFDRDLAAPTRAEFRENLEAYLAREYGIDFNDAFDYEAYREWYDSTAA